MLQTKKTPVFTLLCLVFFMTWDVVFSAGSRSDYDRAEALRSQTQNKVYRETFEPVWQPDPRHFWYKIKTGPESHEFIRVDIPKAEKRPAFDHARLAETLTQAGLENLKPDKLPIEKLEFDTPANRLKFQTNGDIWQCDLATYRLEKIASVAVESLPAYTPDSVPAASTRTGRPVTLTFANQTAEPVTLFWLDISGKPVRYGTVNPGQKYGQNTYGGHIWRVADEQGQPVCVFVAPDNNATAVIGSKEPVEFPSRRNGRSRRALSPDGQWAALIRDHNIGIRTAADANQVTMLTADGTESAPYIDSFVWSPDSKKLAGIHRTNGENRKVWFVESSPADQLQPKLHSIVYAKPGDTIDIDRPCLFDVETVEQISIDNALFQNPYTISDVRWAPDAKSFTFLYNQRGHQVLRIVRVDAATGKTSAVIEDKSDTFICYSQKYFCEFIDDSSEIIWMSERDGWNHLYRIDSSTGRVKNQITRGPWVVRKVEHIDPKTRQIWFQAGGFYPEQDPYFIHYAKINFDGSGLTLLTEARGTHSVRFSPDRRFCVDTWSRVDQPPVHELRDGTTGTLLCELERADASALLKTGWQSPIPFAAKGRDGRTDIYGVIFRPTTFDLNSAYPVIENIYAGPHDSFVPKAFAAYHDSMKMAELGFIVVQIDGMGTSNRSKAFHDVCWKNLADAGFPDRIRWIQAAADKYPSMDISRVGIYGGSAGGQSAAGAVMTHGDFYKVAVADCGCHDNRMDKIWWNEQWMGWPVGPEYEANSNVTLAKGLEGKLLLIVGELDHNVDPASTLQVVNALIKADKDFDLLVIPGTGHGAAGTPYGQRRQADYFVRHLLDCEPRHE